MQMQILQNFQMQMQIFLFSSNVNANTFQKYFKYFSNTFKYFDQYAIPIKTEIIIKNNKFY